MDRRGAGIIEARTGAAGRGWYDDVLLSCGCGCEDDARSVWLAVVMVDDGGMVLVWRLGVEMTF